ncbi:MAG TPA: sulfate ABC transporter ATP-binding protein [Candidatus Didemnitutus sp.]|jgi:sulfate transport system ATP-binding protein
MSVEADNIRKSFGPYTALDDVTLHVRSGGLTALLGPSGSGKTTLLRIIAGLEFADPGSGRIRFHGEDVTATPAGKRRVGFVFQHYALFRHMTVFENIAFGLRVRRWRDRPSRSEIRERVARLLKLVQLEDFGQRLPTQLSGGQRQRVALARALAVEPKVLLLDEPFGALDAKVRKELRRWLRKLHEEVHLTTLFVTHDQEEALEIADEVVIMNQARIEQRGTPQEVYDHPASPFVYEFLGNVNRVTLPSHGFGAADSFSDRGSRVAYVRPHDVDVVPATMAVDAERATIRSIHSAGPVARLTCLRDNDTRDVIEAEMPRQRLKELELRPGDPVLLRMRRARRFAEDFAI